MLPVGFLLWAGDGMEVGEGACGPGIFEGAQILCISSPFSIPAPSHLGFSKAFGKGTHTHTKQLKVNVPMQLAQS